MEFQWIIHWKLHKSMGFSSWCTSIYAGFNSLLLTTSVEYTEGNVYLTHKLEMENIYFTAAPVFIVTFVLFQALHPFWGRKCIVIGNCECSILLYSATAIVPQSLSFVFFWHPAKWEVNQTAHSCARSCRHCAHLQFSF